MPLLVIMIRSREACEARNERDRENKSESVNESMKRREGEDDEHAAR